MATMGLSASAGKGLNDSALTALTISAIVSELGDNGA